MTAEWLGRGIPDPVVLEDDIVYGPIIVSTKVLASLVNSETVDNARRFNSITNQDFRLG